MEQLIEGTSEGVTFTGETWAEVRQWVQDRSAQGEIVATEGRLYLPLFGNGMTTVDPGDTIWFHPGTDKPNFFTVERA
tara:strand:+ start:7916 stop:8149 length:234 start_codon:yes stop_codon:yes gene_type:complete